MSSESNYQNNSLTVNVTEKNNEVHIYFRGKSVDRDPSIFITPLIKEALETAGEKRLFLNFTELEYMNSSSVTPIIKILNEVRNGLQLISICYTKARKWQELSFSALKVFQTRDGRIEVLGL